MATLKERIKAKIKTKIITRLGGTVTAPKKPTGPVYLAYEERSKISADRAKLAKFKNYHRGQRCFIIGNGPSLNQMDLKKLENEVTFAVNGFFYKSDEIGLIPSYYVVEDSHVIQDNIERINKYRPKIHRFFPTEYKHMITDFDQTSFFTMNRGFYEKQSPNYGIPRFSTDIVERIYCGQSVTMMNLQLAFYMGFTEVYLIGMDFSYTIPETAKISGMSIESTDDDPNHFHKDYFGKGKKWHDPQLDRVLLNYRMCNFVYECAGRKISNASVGGKLEVFSRVNFDDLFKEKEISGSPTA